MSGAFLLSALLHPSVARQVQHGCEAADLRRLGVPPQPGLGEDHDVLAAGIDRLRNSRGIASKQTPDVQVHH